MKRTLKLCVGILMISLGILVVGCKGTIQKNESGTQEQTVEKIYTCTMHPEVEETAPGNCPICGMELVEKKTDMETSHDGHME